MNLAKLFFSFLIFTSFLSKAQLDDLLLVEYVDWAPGAGLGVKIFNPTENPISLGSYYLTRYRDGETTPNAQAPLTGMLQPGQIKIFGNSAYCNECSAGCNQIAIVGTNSLDVIAITRGATNDIVDMVGAYGSDNQITVSGVQDAILHNKLVRNLDNCIRYTDEAGTSANSWPKSPTENVITWTAFGISCLSNVAPSLGIKDVNLGEDKTLCNDTTITLSLANNTGDSYLWSNGSVSNIVTLDSSNSGTVSVKVTKNECVATDEINLVFESCEPIITPPTIDSIIKIPNIITPNNDDINEFFTLKGLIRDFPIDLKIYNRWGKLVYKSEDYQNNWNAENLPDGMYYYFVQDALTEYNGWINVIR